MANRYCNLIGSKKISEDFQNINIGFDKVQDEMDSKSSGDHRHPNATDTTDGFMSAQDKAKMDASTASATPGTLAQRDSSGRLKAAAPSAKTDVARKAEIDTVQADLDSHKADVVMHVTEADHEKLDGIQEGAEVNQNAFAKVNDIEASEKTDALTFKGGVGIKITTNPTTNEVIFTASGDSTPGDHGSSHTEYGADPIPVATKTEGGLMSAADKAEFDKMAVEVPKHSEQLKDHAAELEEYEQRIEGVESGLADVPGTPLELQPGLQVVEADQGTPFRMGEVKGRTLINLLGRAGDCESTADWLALGPGIKTLSTERVYGAYSIEVASTKEEQAGFGLRTIGAVKDLTKHYIAVGHVRNVSAQFVYLSFAQVKDNGNTAWFKKGTTVTANQFTYTYVAVSPADLAGKDNVVEVYVRGEASGSGQKIAADGIGLYEITQDEYDAIAKMKLAQVAERYPYVDSMTNVTNPYAIVTGGNLLPPFYEWSIASQAKIVSPYHLLLTPESNYNGSYVSIPCVGNTTYTLQSTVTGQGKLYADVRGADGSHDYHLVENVSVTFTTSADATAIDVLCTNDTTVEGNMEFRDVMLTVGTKPKPFVPQQRSMLAFETELAAHPVDGSNPDRLFIGDDGLPYVLEPWKKVVLDGGLEWRFAERFTGFKTVLAYGATTGAVAGSGFATKYDGKKLGTAGNWVTDGPDNINGDIHLGSIYISVANTDSGWGPDYTPIADEIKAYFLGWRMCQQETAGLYNGTGTRCWGRVTDPRNVIGVGGWDATTVLPTTPAGTDALGNVYTPYRLQYLKAKPTVEPVRKYELGATLSAGSNMVEVGSGIVIRERANPVRTSANDMLINSSVPGEDASRLRHRTDKMIDIYSGHNTDASWVRQIVDQAYGKERAIWFGGTGFDPTAVYYVTYTMLDPTLVAPFNGTVAANLRGTVSDLVQDVSDVQRRLSVVETQKAEKDAAVVWVDASLQNGWVNYGGSFNSAGYSKDDKGVVRLRGLIKSGTVGAVVAFMLPSGFRPMKGLIMSTATYSTASAFGAIEVKSNGAVHVISGGTVYVSLEGISFTAEQ
ncbi:hypothetical protein ABEX25_28390 [Paenibacillus thiaminolyticus]|uniref:hypothetical protein n=1 Tax=Paenibacillus thiaminolyticus TaxID=49283 RepID=UPI003D28605C